MTHMCGINDHPVEDEMSEERAEEKHIYITFELDGHVVDDIMDQYVWDMNRFFKDPSIPYSQNLVFIMDREGVSITYADKWKESENEYAGKICVAPLPNRKRYAIFYGKKRAHRIKVIIHKTPR